MDELCGVVRRTRRLGSHRRRSGNPPREGGKPAHTLIEERCGDAVLVECDVTYYDDCVTAVDAAEEFGGVDIMVNNAGIVGPQVPLVDLDMDEYNSLMRVNLDGVFHGSKAAVFAMVEHGVEGSIVNMSSVAGMVGYGGLTPYSAAQGGVRQFSYDLASYVTAESIVVDGGDLNSA